MSAVDFAEVSRMALRWRWIMAMVHTYTRRMYPARLAPRVGK